MKRVLALVLMLSLFTPLLKASGTAGTQGDPVVTLSYIDRVFVPAFETELGRRMTSGLDSAQKTQQSRLSARIVQDNQALARTAASGSRFVAAVKQKIEQKRTARLTARTVASGQKITGRAGTAFVLRSGQAKITGTVLDLTDGRERTGGDAPRNHYLLAADHGAGLEISADAVVDVDGQAVVRASYTVRYTDLADALNTMGLFQGTGSGYALDRAANRCEALVMMLRLMGEEQAALRTAARHPFADVPSWASPYVAYAYEKGYTKGTSAAKFGSESRVSADQYMTFILRALGYSDADGDFSWDNAVSFAQSAGMLTAGERALLSPVFYRDQMVYVSYYALDAFIKDSGQTLLDSLAGSGVLSRNTAITAKGRVIRARP